jgi:hypothetical protein
MRSFCWLDVHIDSRLTDQKRYEVKLKTRNSGPAASMGWTQDGWKISRCLTSQEKWACNEAPVNLLLAQSASDAVRRPRLRLSNIPPHSY